VAYNMFEDFLIKYAWSALGLILCSFPTFVPSIAGTAGLLETIGAPGSIEGGENRERIRTGNFITNKRYFYSEALLMEG
jgi:ATP-binding cassette, subfamily D (ALD), peroxisomal long-chain fatty acid import protein